MHQQQLFCSTYSPSNLHLYWHGISESWFQPVTSKCPAEEATFSLPTLIPKLRVSLVCCYRELNRYKCLFFFPTPCPESHCKTQRDASYAACLADTWFSLFLLHFPGRVKGHCWRRETSWQTWTMSAWSSCWVWSWRIETARWLWSSSPEATCWSC